MEIIERNRIENDLSKSKGEFQSLIEKNADGMLIVDLSGTTLYVNPAAEAIFNKSSTELVGKIFGFPIVANIRTELDIPQKAGKTAIAEMRVVDIEWEGEKAYLASLRDITDRVKMENELKATHQKMLEHQKTLVAEERLKVLLQMAGATAHELNQPLTTLLGHIELLEYHKTDPEKTKEHIAEIETSGQKIADIVQKIQNIRHDEISVYTGKSTITSLDQKENILAIEDNDIDFESIKIILADKNQISLYRARTIDEALKLLEQDHFDLIFLDYDLPDGTGLDFLDTISKQDRHIPVVLVTGKGNEMIASQAIKAGAYDYLPKDRLNHESLCRVINYTMEKYRLKQEVKQAMEKMAEMSTKDDLTGLYNRRYSNEVLDREMASAKRYKNDLTLCMMDLDHFKNINDTHGHSIGDMVLSDIGRMLKEFIRETDLICRYGGEEFTIILPNTDLEGARTLCERFRKMVAAHLFELNSIRFKLTVSIGIGLYQPARDLSPAQLTEMADRALYQAKNEGRNKVVIDT